MLREAGGVIFLLIFLMSQSHMMTGFEVIFYSQRLTLYTLSGFQLFLLSILSLRCYNISMLTLSYLENQIY